MPCCGGNKEQPPISPVRYYLLRTGFAAGCRFVIVWLALVSIFLPRYRKIAPAYRSNTRAVRMSIRKRERIKFRNAE